MKDPIKADWFFDRYRNLKDSVFSAETSKLYSEEQTKFDVAKKDLELLAQSKELEKDKAQLNLMIAAILFLVLIAGIATWAFVQKRKSNKQVEQKNKLLEHANIEISHQKEELSEKQKEILDSINYAQRIQNALLANEEFLLNNSIPHFILFKPKDIVSGDFTWATKTEPANKHNVQILEPSLMIGSYGKSNSNSSDKFLLPSESIVSITKFTFLSKNFRSEISIFTECASLNPLETRYSYFPSMTTLLKQTSLV